VNTLRRLFHETAAVRFGVVGIAATITYAALAWIATVWLALPAGPSSLAAYGAGSLVSYFGHRAVTFRSERPHREALPRFLGVTVVGYAVSLLIPLLLTDVLGLHPGISIAATCVAIPVLSYLGLSRLVFANP
jgi:putative flippase GtrA